MFYFNPKCAFMITGAFYVERSKTKRVKQGKRDYTSLGYRVKGESLFFSQGKSIMASEKSVVYIPAGVEFERKSTSENLIVVHLKCFGEHCKEIEIINHAQELEPLFRKLQQIWRANDFDAYNKAMQVLYQIFESLRSMACDRSNAIPELIRPGVELLQKGYKDPSLRVSDLADACFISEVYFRNLFHRHFGESPHDALSELRFRYACELIGSGYYTQKEIARLSGFSNVKYFRTAFKRRLGMTVSEYIEENRSN